MQSAGLISMSWHTCHGYNMVEWEIWRVLRWHVLCCAAAQQSAAGNAAQPGYDARSEYFTKEEMAELFKPKKKKVLLSPHNSKASAADMLPVLRCTSSVRLQIMHQWPLQLGIVCALWIPVM